MPSAMKAQHATRAVQKFSHRLAKIAQTAQNKRATGNAIVAMATLTREKVAMRRDFFVKSLLRFSANIS